MTSKRVDRRERHSARDVVRADGINREGSSKMRDGVAKRVNDNQVLDINFVAPRSVLTGRPASHRRRPSSLPAHNLALGCVHCGVLLLLGDAEPNRLRSIRSSASSLPIEQRRACALGPKASLVRTALARSLGLADRQAVSIWSSSGEDGGRNQAALRSANVHAELSGQRHASTLSCCCRDEYRHRAGVDT